MSNCHFGVSPVKYPDPELCSNFRVISAIFRVSEFLGFFYVKILVISCLTYSVHVFPLQLVRENFPLRR